MDEEGVAQKLFHGVAFTVIPSDDSRIDLDIELRDIVVEKGGTYMRVYSPELTHIISNDIDFPQYETAIESGIYVVKPSWVVQSISKNRQAQPRQHSPDPRQFFHDVVLSCASLPEGDHDMIVAGVIALGGQYSSPLTKLVTHLVTTDYYHEKCRLAMERVPSIKIVLPHWFDDCFRLGKKINERPYQFPDPDILYTGQGQPRIRDVPSPHLDGAISAYPSGNPESSPPGSPADIRKNLNAFASKKVMLSKDVSISPHLYKSLEGLINYGGGTLTDTVDDADIVICQYRDGLDYVKASRAGKDVGNMAWLYHVINRNRYSSPRTKLLHYPIPRNGLPGFENMKISVSNYSGDARNYIENLIKHSGAEFTKTMKQDNTHLITAHTQSEKCEAAQEWNINIVNHIWLEESFAKCAAQTLTNPRYTHFPARTNLGEVTGQTSFDMKRVEQMFFPRPRASPHKQLPSPSATAKMKPTPGRVGSLKLANTAVHEDAPTPVAEEDDETEDEQPQPTKKSRGRPRKSGITPSKDNEKENESPLLHTSGRASKTKAIGMLHSQADDIALFQKEMKRKGGVTHGCDRRSSIATKSPSPAAGGLKQKKKRPSDEMTYDATAEGSDLSDGETQHAPSKPAKKAKHVSSAPALPPVRYKMMVTGDERWLAKPVQESSDRFKLRGLGVQVTQDPKDVDILVAPKILRTRKFVAAIACAPIVVHTSYLDAALKQNKLVEKPDILDDSEGEERQGFRLADALERAKDNQKELFRGWSIFVTKDVNGGFDTYKEIVTLNGGAALLYAGRTGLALPKRRLHHHYPESGAESQAEGDENEFDYVYLVSGVSDGEMKLWKTFRALAEKQGLKVRIVETDWLLNAAMTQIIDFDPKWELDENAVMNQGSG